MSSANAKSSPGLHGPDTEAEPSALAALLARVEAAEGPDRQLDGDLCALFAPGARGGRGIQAGAVIRRGAMWTADPVTASLDAALALCERVLPGWEFMLNSEGRRTLFQATIYVDPSRWWAYAKTPALALLAAVLRALIAQAASPESGQVQARDEP